MDGIMYVVKVVSKQIERRRYADELWNPNERDEQWPSVTLNKTLDPVIPKRGEGWGIPHLGERAHL